MNKRGQPLFREKKNFYPPFQGAFFSSTSFFTIRNNVFFSVIILIRFYVQIIAGALFNALAQNITCAA